MIIIIGTITIAPADLADLLPVAATMMAATRQESGCLHYSLAVEDAATGTLSLAERWTGPEALGEHFRSPHMAAFMAATHGKQMSLSANMYDASGERPVQL